ncbi:MAG: hypothetical protein ACQEVA_09765 [Myxococcota bacterium]
MIVRTRLLVAPLFALAIGLLFSTQAQAADWDRFPDPRSHVGIKKRFDGPKYTDLRRCLRGLDSRVGADYYAGLVDVTDEGGSRSRDRDDAHPYADALFEEWELDESKDVLIAVGIRNRSLGVRAGKKWQKLGLDKRTFDETVDGSDYDKHRRRGDYGEAICSLATALDYRLAALQQSMKRRIERIGSRLPDLRKERAALAERVEENFAKEHPYGDELRDKLELAQQFLSDADETLEEEPAKAVNLADNASEAMSEVRQKLQTYREEIEELDDVEAKINSLRRRIEQREDVDREGPQEALSMLEGCQSQVEQTRQTLETDPSSIRVCIADVKTRLASAEVHHEYRSEVVPTVIGVALALIAVVILVALFLRRRRTMRWVRPELEEWERLLTDARQRLEHLTQRFPEYFGSRDPWSGESESLDEEIRHHTTLAALLQERGAKLLADARDAATSVIPLAIIGPEKALRLLREAQVQLESGARPVESPVEAALDRGYDAPANQLLGDLYQALLEGVRLLERAASELEALAELSGEVDDLYRAVQHAVQRRDELGLPMLEMQAQVRDITAAFERVQSLTRRDPLSARGELEGLAKRLESIKSDLEAANEAYEQVTGPLREQGERLRNRVRELKRKGQGVEEPGFSPVDELDSAARLAERVLELAQEGRGEDALEKARELADALDELQRLIQVSEQAQDIIPIALDAIKEQRDALKSDILKVRVAIGRAQEQADSNATNGYMAQVSDLQSSLSDRALHLSRIQRALHQGKLLSAAADASRTVHHLERGKSLTEQLARELGVDRDAIQSASTVWPEDWQQSALSSWTSARFGSAGSTDLPW